MEEPLEWDDSPPPRPLARKIGELAAVLAAVAVVGGALYAVFSYRDQLADTSAWNTAFFLKTPDNRLRLGGVALGMSLAEVRRKRPGLNIVKDGLGDTTGLYDDEGAHYAVSFLAAAAGRQAYRIRYQRTFEGSAENRVLRRLGKRFGKPSTSTCRKGSAAAARRCEFRWWPKGGVAIRMESRLVKDAKGKAWTQIALTAEDTYLVAKRWPGGEPPTVPLDFASGPPE